MSVKRIIILIWFWLQGATIYLTIAIGLPITILYGLIIRLWDMLTQPTGAAAQITTFYISWFEFVPAFFSILIGTAIFGDLITNTKKDSTAEILFSMPVTIKEFMFSLWTTLIFVHTVAIYAYMGAYVLIAGTKFLPNISSFIWLQPLPMVITWVSAGGLFALLFLLETNLIKTICYSFIVFLPLTGLTALISILLLGKSMPGGTDYALFIPIWLSEWLTSSFIYPHWSRWLPTALYLPLWFFILIRKTDVGNFISPHIWLINLKWKELIPW